MDILWKGTKFDILSESSAALSIVLSCRVASICIFLWVTNGGGGGGGGPLDREKEREREREMSSSAHA